MLRWRQFVPSPPKTPARLDHYFPMPWRVTITLIRNRVVKSAADIHLIEYTAHSKKKQRVTASADFPSLAEVPALYFALSIAMLSLYVFKRETVSHIS